MATTCAGLSPLLLFLAFSLFGDARGESGRHFSSCRNAYIVIIMPFRLQRRRRGGKVHWLSFPRHIGRRPCVLRSKGTNMPALAGRRERESSRPFESMLGGGRRRRRRTNVCLWSVSLLRLRPSSEMQRREIEYVGSVASSSLGNVANAGGKKNSRSKVQMPSR